MLKKLDDFSIGMSIRRHYQIYLQVLQTGAGIPHFPSLPTFLSICQQIGQEIVIYGIEQLEVLFQHAHRNKGPKRSNIFRKHFEKYVLLLPISTAESPYRREKDYFPKID